MKNDGGSVLKDHPVVSHEKWLNERMAFLEKEKEFTHLRDELNQRRRELPWVAVENEYIFDGPNGQQTLADLLDGRSQLVVYHAMFDPKSASASTGWTKDAACEQCSFWADTYQYLDLVPKGRDEGDRGPSWVCRHDEYADNATTHKGCRVQR